MDTLYFSHPAYSRHEMGAGHPEGPERLAAIERGLRQARLWTGLQHRQAPAAERSALERAHRSDYIGRLYADAPTSGYRQLDPDTIMNPDSLTAAEHAAGAVLAAVEAVLAGEADNAFCAVRPPGHHAERARAMGFCLFSNVAVAALHALEVRGLQRVAILDFDVHHGNGTEDIVTGDNRILFCSTYQYPLFPFPSNAGIPGHIVKSPLAAGAGGREFRSAVENDWLPAVSAFRPELVLVSAGFDAHAADPLAGLNLAEEDFAWVGERILEAADETAQGRVVASLEGGYDLAALAASAAAFIATLTTAA